MNLACVGATAKAVVNCLNFGNPEHPEVMWQLSESIDGMAEACKPSGCRLSVATCRSITRAAGPTSTRRRSSGSSASSTNSSRHPGVELADGRRDRTRWRTTRRRQRAHFHSPVRAGRRVADDAADACAGPTRSVHCNARLRHEGSCVDLCREESSDVTAVHDVVGGGLATALAEMVCRNGDWRACWANSKVTVSCSASSRDDLSLRPATSRRSRERAARRACRSSARHVRRRRIS